jgi:hypothetical protein
MIATTTTTTTTTTTKVVVLSSSRRRRYSCYHPLFEIGYKFEFFFSVGTDASGVDDTVVVEQKQIHNSEGKLP